MRPTQVAGLLLALALAASAIADAPAPKAPVPPPNDRLHVQEAGALRVTTAVPSREETRAVFDFDLYRRNVQPVWVKVENLGDVALVLAPMGVDRFYFTPREIANRTRTDNDQVLAPSFEAPGVRQLEVPARGELSGYVFSRVDQGTKSFNVDVLGSGAHQRLTFFVPVPGLRLDHYEVDFEALYPADTLVAVDTAGLAELARSLPCCVRDARGEDEGDPLNFLLIGELADLYYSFMRAGWDETETIYGKSLLKTGASAVFGGRYRYSPVSALYVFGRPQDAALQRARESINERNHLRIWLTRYRHEDKPVWLGQISRDIGVRFTKRTITTHKIDPDVDETREFLIEDLAYNQGLAKFGYVDGVGAASYDDPRHNLTGDPYFTDGRRAVLWLSTQPTALDEIEFVHLDGSSPGSDVP